jgi:hypothetical protein
VIAVRTAALLLGIAAASPALLLAQEWRATLETGRLRLDGVPAGSASALGLRLARDWVPGGISVRGAVPLDGRDPAWGALGGWYRFERTGVLRAGFGVAGEAWAHGGAAAVPDAGRGIAIEAGPDLSIDFGPARFETRAALFQLHRAVGGERATRTVPALELRAASAPLPRLDLVLEAAAYRADHETPTYAGILARWTHAPVTAWASAGAWLAGDAAPPRGAGVAIRFANRLSLTAAAQRRTLDPYFAAPPRNTWSIGASVRLGGSHALRAPVAPEDDEGRTTILLRATDVTGKPRIAGDFNGWIPQAMTRNGDQWSLAVRLSPGVYHYAFVTPEGEWFVPASTPGRREDGMGGHVAVLIVNDA